MPHDPEPTVENVLEHLLERSTELELWASILGLDLVHKLAGAAALELRDELRRARQYRDATIARH